MASVPPATTTVKPTFAKASLEPQTTHGSQLLTSKQVAASGYKAPPSGKENSLSNTKSKTSMASPPPQNTSPPKAEITQLADHRNGITKVDSANSKDNSDDMAVNDISKAGEMESSAKRPQEPNVVPGTITADDGNTQVSSSNGSAKQAGLDSKSVVSVATFGMDEKESLRPEDSASLKATEEEDRLSAQGSGPNGSRAGSDSGARAFRDQLREISNVEAPAPRGAPPNPFAPAMILSPDATFDGPIMADTQMPPLAQPIPVMLPQPPAPDERLIEALASGRDRVWVLKLEQDIIDFLRDSRLAPPIIFRQLRLTTSSEKELTLPQCNSFYRMLAHKLADYYMLDHTVDSTTSGAAVVIRRTPFCPPLCVDGNSIKISRRLLEYRPPPLSALPNLSSVASTPPPSVPARKIMRRDGNPTSFPSTTANSEGPSKATSEAGGESNSDGGAPASGGQGKTTMTREEREAKYNEVRLRIFGTLESSEAIDGENKSEGKDGSRASSASGKKKGKKQRDDSDDFEPRSMFQMPPYYSTQGYDAGGISYFNPYNMAPGTQYPMMSQHGPAGYPNSYQPTMQPEQQVQYQYPSSPYPMYAHPGSADYDLATSFQRGMQSFQNTSPSPQMQSRSPMVHNGYSQAPYQVQPPQYNQQWPTMQYTQQYPQVMYVPQQYPDRPMSSPGQLPPTGTYPFPPPNTAPPYQNGQQHKMQPPMQPPFIAAKFNPQSQTFVPGHRMPPMPQQQMPQMSQMPSMQPMQQMPMVPTPRLPPQPMQMPPQPSPSMATRSRQASSYNSPRLPNQPTPLYANPMSVGNGSLNIYSATNNNIPTTQQPLSHPLPTPPNPSSSIAKWGTPSHLPAKPPPPATLEPFKYNELTRGYQGLPGMPFVGPNGVQGLGQASGYSTTANGNGVSNGNANNNGATSGGAERGPAPPPAQGK